MQPSSLFLFFHVTFENFHVPRKKHTICSEIKSMNKELLVMYYYYMHIKCWNLCGFSLNKTSLTFQKGTSINMQLVHNNAVLAPNVQSNVSLYQRMKGGNMF